MGAMTWARLLRVRIDKHISDECEGCGVIHIDRISLARGVPGGSHGVHVTETRRLGMATGVGTPRGESMSTGNMDIKNDVSVG